MIGSWRWLPARTPLSGLEQHTADGGLARLDKDGAWQTYSTANTKLPVDIIQALAVGADGALWIRSNNGGGLARIEKEGRLQTYSDA
jgi:hypothetical protein